MRLFKLGLAALAVSCVLSASAQAGECAKITALGQNVTHDLAVLFSTNALKNTLAGQGRIGKGAVNTKCKDEGATTTCYSSQVACKGGVPKSCLGAWFCF